MKSTFMLVIGLVLGVALGAFCYDHFIAAPERERAAYELDSTQRRIEKFDPLKCSEFREALMQQVEVCIQVNQDMKGDLDKCQTAQASAGLPIPGKNTKKK